MLATRNIRKKAKRYSDVTLTDNDRFEADTVSPHDKDAIKVKVKDHVMYDKYAGTTVKVDGEEQLIVKAADILAVIEK